MYEFPLFQQTFVGDQLVVAIEKTKNVTFHFFVSHKRHEVDSKLTSNSQ